jgi:hypothetical protein
MTCTQAVMGCCTELGSIAVEAMRAELVSQLAQAMTTFEV